MACAEQHQTCFGRENCTPLSGRLDMQSRLIDELEGPGGGASMRVRQWWVMKMVQHTRGETLVNIINQLESNSLTSRFTIANAMQAGTLPPDQWQRDVRYWFRIMMASLQYSLLASMMGDVPQFPEPNEYYRFPERPEEHAICANMKITSPEHVSFNVFGLAFIGVFGLFAIILSWTIEPLMHCVRERYMGRDKYARLEWYATGTLQMQRMAHEELGLMTRSHDNDTVTWFACDGDVPITKDNATLAGLDISDEKHPVLLLRRNSAGSLVKRQLRQDHDVMAELQQYPDMKSLAAVTSTSTTWSSDLEMQQQQPVSLTQSQTSSPLPSLPLSKTNEGIYHICGPQNQVQVDDQRRVPALRTSVDHTSDSNTVSPVSTK